MAKRQIVCLQCGFQGYTKTHTPGSFWMECVLWLFFILPGLIYSIWRLTARKAACPQCESTNLAPVDSPIGRKMRSELQQSHQKAS